MVKIMKNNVSRVDSQHQFDEILLAQKNGFPVTLSQIEAADAQFTEAACRENVADLLKRLYDVGAEFETLAGQRKKARAVWRDCLHKQDELRELIKKIEAYLVGVNLKLNIAVGEESEVLELLEQVPDGPASCPHAPSRLMV
jgi:hypothetical protein